MGVEFFPHRVDAGVDRRGRDLGDCCHDASHGSVAGRTTGCSIRPWRNRFDEMESRITDQHLRRCGCGSDSRQPHWGPMARWHGRVPSQRGCAGLRLPPRIEACRAHGTRSADGSVGGVRRVRRLLRLSRAVAPHPGLCRGCGPLSRGGTRRRPSPSAPRRYGRWRLCGASRSSGRCRCTCRRG